MYDAVIFIGRFQPPHSGHLALLREALARARRVVVIVGSAHQARSPRNPFTWQERAALLRALLPEAGPERLLLLPVRDYYDEPRWARAVQRAVAEHVDADARVALIGHFKDNTSGYLRSFPGWALERMPRQGEADATVIRDAFFGATPATLDAALAPLAAELPAPIGAWLQAFARGPHYQALQQEWRMLRDYRASWASAPFAPIFVTVDAVLRCRNQVLLIQRAQTPGKGLWALPGGFLEPSETLWQSCLRELAEETSLTLPEERLRAALRSVQVFDHPNRSQRGRVITHAYYIDLGDTPPLPVRAADDAAHAQWLPIVQLQAMEGQFHDDHWNILGNFFSFPALDS